MSKNLVIVESPAKSITIEKYLGSDFIVTSSKGHIRDLTTRGYGGFGVDIENNFEPRFKIMKDKKTVVKELKKLVKTVDKVYLATDPDREGEAISWHLYEALELEKKECERIVFNEITKDTVVSAINKGRDIDLDLVHSQIARRVIDRIIGFSLSKLLQRKIGSKSAGRVQSIALKFVVEREKEIQSFIPEEYWEAYINFSKKGNECKAQLKTYNGKKIELSNKEDMDKVVNSLNDNYIIKDIVFKDRQRKAKPPFITSSLQQTAVSKLNFKAKKTMQIAQKLYEGIDIGEQRVGLITYMRTDSVRLSQEFINNAEKEIISVYGEKYYQGYNVKTKNAKNVQDAHEAIRPTHVDYTPAKMKEYLTRDEHRLYSLIYYRAIAALMSNAVLKDQKVFIDNSGYGFEISGNKLIFDGFLKAYKKFEKVEDNILPDLDIDEKLKDVEFVPEQKFTTPPNRYSEASLIRKMEEMGIGRPSTYAVTMETLKFRNYAKLEKKAFHATKQGLLTSEKLNEYFSSVINVEYTANMESALDKISEGDLVWNDEVSSFYNIFKPLVEIADAKMERIYPKTTDMKCPECGEDLLIRNGRFGEFIACSGFPKCHHTEKKEQTDPPVSTGYKCPNCETGVIVIREAKKGKNKGKNFYACNQYPKCKSTYTSLDEVKEELNKK